MLMVSPFIFDPARKIGWSIRIKKGSRTKIGIIKLGSIKTKTIMSRIRLSHKAKSSPIISGPVTKISRFIRINRGCRTKTGIIKLRSIKRKNIMSRIRLSHKVMGSFKSS